MAQMEMDIGISKKDRKAIADGLSRLLADTYTLYLKTHHFHWNVEGPMFNTLHLNRNLPLPPNRNLPLFLPLPLPQHLSVGMSGAILQTV